MEETARAPRVSGLLAALGVSAGFGLAAAMLHGALSTLSPQEWLRPSFSASATAGLISAVAVLGHWSLLFRRTGAFWAWAEVGSGRPVKETDRANEEDGSGKGQSAVKVYCEILTRQVGESIQKTAEMANVVLRSLEATKAKVDELKSIAVQNRQRAVEVGERLHSALASHSESRERVKPLVATIGHLARKSTLIAINAAIEAAHAGSAGAGFAILADELRALALEITETSRVVETELGAMAETTIQEREGLAALVASMQDVSETLISSAELVSAASLDALGHLQLQDVVRQQLEQVQSGLIQLSNDPRQMGGSSQDPAFEQRLASAYQGYVMDSQRRVHDQVLGRAANQHAAPAIELF